jgi:hypothetical protein
MRVTTTPAFSDWLLANSGVYPYSNLKATRNSFFCKWVMLKGEDLDIEEYFPVAANSLPKGLLLELIASGNGKPLPPEISTIMDSLFRWGRIKDHVWYDESLEVIGDALWTDNDEERKHLVTTLISMKVRALIWEYFHSTSMAADLLHLNWLAWFSDAYYVGPQAFHAMAEYSFEYVHWSIAQVNYHAFAPTTVNLY